MFSRRITFLLAAIVSFAAISTASAQVGNLRVSEVDPDADQAEVLNTGGAFTSTTTYWWCHHFIYSSTIAIGTNFPAAGYKLFSVSGLDDADADLWLYLDASFGSSASLVHGLKYGPASNVGRTYVAVGGGVWPGTSAFVPSPPVGTTLAWDEFGFDPKDWYIDETPSLGSADTVAVATVAPSLVYPASTQDFEGLQLGDMIHTVTDWAWIDASAAPGMFTARVVNDVLGDTSPRGSSTQWLRVRDQDGSDTQNRFYSPDILTDSITTEDYAFTFFVNLEELPPGGNAIKPRLTVQHFDVLFQNAWGIEFTSTEANLIVTDFGGGADTTKLYDMTSPTGVGDWVELKLYTDFTGNTINADVNGAPSGTLPISPALSTELDRLRFCYRGEGTGNINTMLIDDIGFAIVEPTGATTPNAGVVTLGQNYPNPFNPATTIEYHLDSGAFVELRLFDAAGRHVVTLDKGLRAVGGHRVTWDGRDATGRRVASGTYFYQLEAGGELQSRKLLLLK